MDDIDLPVWTIVPNWQQGIRERLSWMTDVIASTYGTEQRRALRLSPRREFEMTFNPLDGERSYLELFLHRLGSTEFMLPLFHDRARLSAPIAAGEVTIPIDTAYREFQVGDLAIILGEDAWTFDKLEVSAVAADSITVAAGNVTRDWSAGSSVHPMRRSRVAQESASAAIISRVGAATIVFQLNQANDLEDEGEWDALYNGYPILLDKPNWREQRDVTFQRQSLLLDNDHGLRALGDDAGRAFTLDTHSRLLEGRAEHWTFRQFLYRLRGQQGSIWVPTFSADLQLSRAAVAANARLDIRKIGYAYTGGAVSGRTHVLLNGSTTCQITGTTGAITAAEERLTLAAPLGIDLTAGATGSFMDTCRLASDDIEIMHYTDTDGVAECALSFKSFRDERVEPAILEHLIPITPQSDTMCGAPAPEEADCFIVPESGFWVEMNFDWTYDDPLLPSGGAGINLSFYDADDNLLGNASSFSHPSTFSMTVNDTGKVVGQQFRMLTSIYPTNPFADQPDGRPARITAQLQFGAFTVPARPGGAHIRGRANWRLPDDVPVALNADPHDPAEADLFGIFSLWPINVTFTF